jgi:hypothetical protein
MIQIQPLADKKVAPPDFEVYLDASRQTFRVAHGKERAAAAQKPCILGLIPALTVHGNRRTPLDRK